MLLHVVMLVFLFVFCATYCVCVYVGIRRSTFSDVVVVVSMYIGNVAIEQIQRENVEKIVTTDLIGPESFMFIAEIFICKSITSNINAHHYCITPI